MEFSTLKEANKYKKEVRTLTLRGQQLEVIPDKIKKFSGLKVLDVSDNPIVEIPLWLKKLEGLEVLDLSYTKVNDIPAELIECRSLKKIGSKRLSTRMKRLIREMLGLLADLRSFEAAVSVRMNWYHLFYGKEVSTLPKAVLLVATNSALEKIRRHAVKEISIRAKKPLVKKPITVDSVLTFVGILSNRAYFLERLNQLGITVVAVANDKTTHLVVGEFMGLPDATLLKRKSLVVLTERDLQQALDDLETPYLQRDGFEDGINNLKQMLEGTGDQIELAFEIMSGGGVPALLETDIFIIWKLHYNSYLQSRAKRLLAQYATPKLADWIKNDEHYLPGMTERQLTIYFKRCGKKTALDAIKIAEELYRKHQKGQPFLLEFKQEPPVSPFSE